MKLYVTVAPGTKYERPYASLEKEVAWPCAPANGDIVFVGRDDDGKGSSINARVALVAFCSHGEGSITVECVIENCRDEYDGIISAMLNDGFRVQYTFA